MTLGFQYFYFGSVMTMAFLLTGVSFHYYSDSTTGIGWISDVPLITNVRQYRTLRPVHNDKVNYPWIDDPTCRNFSVKFAKNKSLPKWALTSFPGSGVTWTRQLIEGVTGIFTGTVYGSSEPAIIDGNHHGNEAENECGCTIIQDHGYPETYPFIGTVGPYENRGILLIRNPFDALFTFSHFLSSGNDQKGTVSPSRFNSPEWDQYVTYVASEWSEHADRWIQISKMALSFSTNDFYEILEAN